MCGMLRNKEKGKRRRPIMRIQGQDKLIGTHCTVFSPLFSQEGILPCH